MKYIEDLMTRAEHGDPEAQNDLAYCYAFGDGIEQNVEEAVKLWKLIAERVEESQTEESIGNHDLDAYYDFGDSGMVMYELGCHYYDGIGIEQNYEEAVRWFKNSLCYCEQPHPICALARCYYYGHGVEQDYEKALDLYAEALDEYDGYPEAEAGLALCYFEGNGTNKDEKKAAFWWKCAGDDYYKLGRDCYNDRHLDFAKKWYEKAIDMWKRSAALENEAAKRSLSLVRFYDEK